MSRLLKELEVDLGGHAIRVERDNQQTIRLVNNEIGMLHTQLRHADVVNHWLQQEVSENRINVDYVKTTDMIADGLTKVLQANKQNTFYKQLSLVNVTEILQKKRERELQEGEDQAPQAEQAAPK